MYIWFRDIIMSSVWFMQALSWGPGLNMPLLPNVVKLVVCVIDFEQWDTLLNNMPNIEHITFVDVSLCVS